MKQFLMLLTVLLGTATANAADCVTVEGEQFCAGATLFDTDEEFTVALPEPMFTAFLDKGLISLARPMKDYPHEGIFTHEVAMKDVGFPLRNGYGGFQLGQTVFSPKLGKQVQVAGFLPMQKKFIVFDRETNKYQKADDIRIR